MSSSLHPFHIRYTSWFSAEYWHMSRQRWWHHLRKFKTMLWSSVWHSQHRFPYRSVSFFASLQSWPGTQHRSVWKYTGQRSVKCWWPSFTSTFSRWFWCLGCGSWANKSSRCRKIGRIALKFRDSATRNQAQKLRSISLTRQSPSWN